MNDLPKVPTDQDLAFDNLLSLVARAMIILDASKSYIESTQKLVGKDTQASGEEILTAIENITGAKEDV